MTALMMHSVVVAVGIKLGFLDARLGARRTPKCQTHTQMPDVHLGVTGTS